MPKKKKPIESLRLDLNGKALHLYNDENDINRLFEGIEKVKSYFKVGK